MSHSETQSRQKLLHDLRSPLTAILGFSELLEDEIVGPLNERQLRYVQQVLTAGRAMLVLLEEGELQSGAPRTNVDDDPTLIFPDSKATTPIE